MDSLYLFHCGRSTVSSFGVWDERYTSMTELVCYVWLTETLFRSYVKSPETSWGPVTFRSVCLQGHPFKNRVLHGLTEGGSWCPTQVL